jgi:hypothetical protein
LRQSHTISYQKNDILGVFIGIKACRQFGGIASCQKEKRENKILH